MEPKNKARIELDYAISMMTNALVIKEVMDEIHERGYIHIHELIHRAPGATCTLIFFGYIHPHEIPGAMQLSESAINALSEANIQDKEMSKLVKAGLSKGEAGAIVAEKYKEDFSTAVEKIGKLFDKAFKDEKET